MFISFLAAILSIGINLLVGILINVLSGGVLAGLKITWYVGKTLYYLIKAFTAPETDSDPKN